MTDTAGSSAGFALADTVVGIAVGAALLTFLSGLFWGIIQLSNRVSDQQQHEEELYFVAERYLQLLDLAVVEADGAALTGTPRSLVFRASPPFGVPADHNVTVSFIGDGAGGMEMRIDAGDGQSSRTTFPELEIEFSYFSRKGDESKSATSWTSRQLPAHIELHLRSRKGAMIQVSGTPRSSTPSSCHVLGLAEQC